MSVAQRLYENGFITYMRTDSTTLSSAAVNAVFFNQLAAIEDETERAAKRAELMEEYAEGVDLLHLDGEDLLDEPVDLTGAIHIWTSRKLNGVVIPEGPRQYPGEPPN